MRNLWVKAVRLLERGESFVLATVIRTRGSTPRKAGSRMIVCRNGDIVGSLGGGCVEGDVWSAATEMLKRGNPATRKQYHLNEPVESPHGMICGGTMEFLLEPVDRPDEFFPIARAVLAAIEGGAPVSVATGISPGNIGKKSVRPLDREALRRTPESNPHLDADSGTFIEFHRPLPSVLFMGGGHIAKATESFAGPLGFRFSVIDDRPLFANRDRFLEADDILVREFESAFDDDPVAADTPIVVATRGHRYDDIALEAAIRTPAKYVGLVSSRRKWLLLRRKLLERGLPENRVGEIHAPIGLDLGSRSPEEIALSILGEIVAFRNGREGKPLKYDPGLGT